MEKKRKAVVFTGAGMSADSGLSTFRDADGLWENHRIEDVCTPEALARDPRTVIDFYNQRRKQMLEAKPNAGHYAVAELEKYYDVEVITQNVDNLHERAGSSRVTHLHGELTKLRSSADPDLVYDLEGWEQKPGLKCAKGSPLRPHIVFFGEPVPQMDRAVRLTREADIFIVVGTSLNVYPAAGLLHYVPASVAVYVVDPNQPKLGEYAGRVRLLRMRAAEGMPFLVRELEKQA